MVEFFNAKMQECGLCTASGRPVITAQIDMEKNYAFLEVCSLEIIQSFWLVFYWKVNHGCSQMLKVQKCKTISKILAV